MTRFKDVPLHLPDLQSRRDQATVKLIGDMHQLHQPLHNLLPPREGAKAWPAALQKPSAAFAKNKNKQTDKLYHPLQHQAF